MNKDLDKLLLVEIKNPILDKVLILQPPFNHLICFFDNCIGAKLLYVMFNPIEYKKNMNLFYSCLAIIICNLDQTELDMIYNINLLSFFARLNPKEKKNLKNLFSNAYAVNKA